MKPTGLTLFDDHLRRLAHGVPDLSQPALEPADLQCLQDSPLCGDQVHLQAQVAAGRYTRFHARAEGCVLCRAATRVVAERARGHALGHADAAVTALESLWGPSGALSLDPAWTVLSVFAPLRTHRNRRHCVLLPFLAWRAMERQG